MALRGFDEIVFFLRHYNGQVSWQMHLAVGNAGCRGRRTALEPRGVF